MIQRTKGRWTIVNADGSNPLKIEIYSEGHEGDNYISIDNDLGGICCNLQSIDFLILALQEAKVELEILSNLE